LLRGITQKPDIYGKRKTRAIVIRNSFPELKSTTIPSYLSWFRDISKIVYGSPITSTVQLPLPDGTIMEQEIFFIGLDDEQSASKLFSMELTFGFLDEFVHIPEHILNILSGRIGRYPEVRFGGPSWYGYWGTSNPCSVEHWYYRLSQELRPPGYSFYHQPPGVIFDDKGKLITNPDAENLKYLVDGYYTKQSIGKDEDYIKVFLMGLFGELRAGKPVYPQYKDDIHFSKEDWEPNKNLPIVVGMDVGLHGNAVVFTQLLPTGTVVIFDEIFSKETSISEFAQNVLIPHINNNYFKYNMVFVVDPSARTRSPNSKNKKSAFDILRKDFNLPVETAVTNDILARVDAVVTFLVLRDGFVVTPKASWVRRGLISEYKYKEIKGSLGTRFHDSPEKNEHSHIADALQYACLKHKRVKSKRRIKIRPTYTSIGDSISGY